MGTRADFYVGTDERAEWLGSIGWDGYPSGIPDILKAARSEAGYRDIVAGFLAGRDDATLPAMGWPWPWEDSRTTDYAYAWHPEGFVLAWYFGAGPWRADADEPEDIGEKDGRAWPQFPTDRPTMGKRSGLIVF